MILIRRLCKISNFIKSNFIKSCPGIKKRNLLFKLLPFGFCLSNNETIRKIEFQTPKVLTHEYLLQQASSVSGNAASQLLTQTVVAILDTAEQYKKAMLDLMSLLQDSKDAVGNNNLQQDLSDLIIASRSKVNDFKTQLIELDTLLNYVEKVVISTAETSYLAGAEFVSTTLSERLYSAKLQVDEVMKKIKLLENDYLNLYKEVIFDSDQER